MKLETRRNNSSGEICVNGESFAVHISENGFIQIAFPERTIELMRFGKIRVQQSSNVSAANPNHDANAPSPRSKAARRGSR
jgi:flagellar basal body rod protein FlgG